MSRFMANHQVVEENAGEVGMQSCGPLRGGNDPITGQEHQARPSLADRARYLRRPQRTVWILADMRADVLDCTCGFIRDHFSRRFRLHWNSCCFELTRPARVRRRLHDAMCSKWKTSLHSRGGEALHQNIPCADRRLAVISHIGTDPLNLP